MIKHIVMWKFRDQAEGADRAQNLHEAKALLDGCAQLAPGTLEFEVALARSGMECTYDLVLYSEFTDVTALNAYLDHPQHLALKPFMAAARLERQCMDYQVA